MTIVRTQSELNAALKRKDGRIEIHGDGDFMVRAYDSVTVRAYGSVTVRAYDSVTVTAYDSVTVRAYGSVTVRAYGSATVTASDSVTVTASDSVTVTAAGSVTVTAAGSVTVRAYDSVTVRAYDSVTVRASGSATVRAYDSVTVTAAASVPVQDYGPDTRITAAIIIPIRTPETTADWCAFYGLKVTRGWVVVFKAVDHELNSERRFAYPVGDEVTCPDWSPTAECGQGLHFSPHPFMATAFFPGAARWLAVKVKVSECVLLGDKLKAPRCRVLREVNEDGSEVAA